jgi:hypothetical protein
LYVGAIAIPLALLITLLINLVRHEEAPGAPTVRENKQAADTIRADSAIAPSAPVPVESNAKVNGATPAIPPAKPKTKSKKMAASKKAKVAAGKKSKDRQAVSQAATNTPDVVEKKVPVASSSSGTDAFISVSCKEGAEVFVDGARKGRIGSKPLVVAVPPGPHTVIVSHTSGGIYTQNVEMNAGKSVHIKPSFCD